MSRTRTLQELRTEVRQRADMVNSAFVTDQLVDRCINQSWAQLYDRLLATGEDYYIKYVDLGPQAGTSTSPTNYDDLQSVGLTPFATLSPALVGGYVWCVDGNNHVVAVSPTTGELLAYTFAGNPTRREACSDGSRYVMIAGNPESVIGFNPTLPPTAAFATTSWSPPLGPNEDVDTENGVYFDSVSGEYVTMFRDTSVYTSRLVRFTVVGAVATITASVSLPAAPAIQDVARLLYSRPGFVGIWSVGNFQEFDLSSMSASTTVAYAPKLEFGAYDAATGRALCVSQGAPYMPVFDVSGAALLGTLDAAVTSAGATPGYGAPRAVNGKWWLSVFGTTSPPTVAGYPVVVEADPATLSAQPLLSVPGTTGIWADSFVPGVMLAVRSTFPLGITSGADDSFAVYAFGATSQTSTDFYDFESFTSSTNAPATDVYQVRGVDARYSDNVVVNLPRYNWEERNVYNTLPQLTPYYPVTAYRVIQNPLNGKDCIQFIPTTPNGVSSYRVWYYPNPKVLTANTDTIDGRSGWEEWVVVDAAIKLLTIEESDTSGLEREAQRVWARIMGVVENRDAGQGKRITDVNMNAAGWPFPAGYPRRY